MKKSEDYKKQNIYRILYKTSEKKTILCPLDKCWQWNMHCLPKMAMECKPNMRCVENSTENRHIKEYKTWTGVMVLKIENKKERWKQDTRGHKIQRTSNLLKQLVCISFNIYQSKKFQKVIHFYESFILCQVHFCIMCFSVREIY
jgi:hypothetical protein